MEKPSMIKRFFSFLLRLIVVLMLMVMIAVGSFEGVTYYLSGSFYDLRNALKGDGKKAVVHITKNPQEETKIDDKNMKNTLFFVESNDGLSRYTSLVMMNTETNAVDLLLVPLHVQVTVGGKLLTEIQKKIPGAGSTLELDDIARVYGEDKYRIISDVFSQIFALNISGYDVLSQKQFEDLLDINGSVSYHFADLLSYRDEQQQLQYFQAGDQQLSGSEAMILMSHMDGTDKQESDRLERANTFLESWLDKLIGAGKGTDLVGQVEKTAASSEGRDFTEEKKVWGDLTPNGVTLRILQGAESKGVFSIDSQKAKLQISTLVKQSADYRASDDQDSVGSLGDDTETAASSKDYYIELYNAAFRQGLASEWESYLEEEGYNISLIASYQDEGPLSTTRIVVSQEGIGQDLLKYFSGADIEIGEIVTGGDIQVFIGTDHINVGTSESSSDTADFSDRSDSDSGKTDSAKAKDSDFDEKDSAKAKGSDSGKDDEKDEDDEKGKDKGDEKQTGDQNSGNSSGYYNFDKDSE